jgi:signal transduction histidine kinase
MSTAPDPLGSPYGDYRAEVEGEPMARALGTGLTVVIGLNTAFVLLDYVVYPQLFLPMLGFRLGCNVLLGWLFARTRHSQPLVAAFIGCMVTGLMLLTVIQAAGGMASGYAPGLLLLFVGMPVLLPLRAVQAAGIVFSLSAVMAALPFAFGPSLATSTYLVHLAFPLAGAFESVAACWLMDEFRFADFQRRRELEQARDDLKDLDREKSRFTANVHHELRTPLTLTLAPLEAMLDGEFGDVPEVQRSYLKSMRSNSQRLLKLINNLLDLAKIEGEGLDVRRRPTRVQDLVSELLSGARPLAERKGITLECGSIADLPMVHVDPDAFEKVLMNLVGNALKFTEQGGRIEVTGEAIADGGIHLVVSDTGAGLEASQLARIFDRFAQVDSSNTKRHEGTGIGLALVEELISLHHGRIWAESAGLGHGTQIHIELPLGEVDVEADEAVLETEQDSAKMRDSLAAIESELEADQSSAEGVELLEMERSVERAQHSQNVPEGLPVPGEPGAAEVLLVDDNADMRRLLADLVGKHYRIRLASNGREALEKLRERVPDLVLTDVMMPEMTGTELCSAIKSNPQLARVPVMLVTSKAEREMKIKGLELGADDYVTKPFHPRELLARVDSLIRVRVLQEELSVRNALLESTNEELKSTVLELRDTASQLVQAERLAAVGELAAGIAHEVNNPVNFAMNALRTLQSELDRIRNLLEALTQVAWDDKSRLDATLAELKKIQESVDLADVSQTLAELLSIATEGLERTVRLVGDLRDFAAPSDGLRMDMDLRRGIESTLHLVNRNLRDRSIELDVQLPPDLPLIPGDAGAINQVFLNLLKNATESLDGRQGTILVSATCEGEWVIVEVRDDGPGIAAEHLSQVFEPFYSTKSSGDGTGLGLSMSRRIVGEHGGSIEVESTEGEGACFRVRLPVQGSGAA